MNITCRNINKSYADINSQNQNCVLKNIDLKIKTGEAIALRGPSGSGKTTLLNIISGLDDPSSGDILFDDILMRNLDTSARAVFRNQNLGIIYQFFNLLDDFNVYENIAMPLLLRGENKKNVHEKISSIVDKIGISEKINSNVKLLSGGESQRVAIARAIIGLPRIILADEPTGNLDKDNTDKVVSLLIETCKRNNTSLLMVTHDIDCLLYTSPSPRDRG